MPARGPESCFCRRSPHCSAPGDPAWPPPPGGRSRPHAQPTAADRRRGGGALCREDRPGRPPAPALRAASPRPGLRPRRLRRAAEVRNAVAARTATGRTRQSILLRACAAHGPLPAQPRQRTAYEEAVHPLWIAARRVPARPRPALRDGAGPADGSGAKIPPSAPGSPTPRPRSNERAAPSSAMAGSPRDEAARSGFTTGEFSVLSLRRVRAMSQRSLGRRNPRRTSNRGVPPHPTQLKRRLSGKPRSSWCAAEFRHRGQHGCLGTFDQTSRS
jgi:hypothetical protein